MTHKILFNCLTNIDFKKKLSIAKSNLGYYAGYYSNEVRERVEKLFCCAHSVFGSIKENGISTPQEAFDMGKNMNNHVK